MKQILQLVVFQMKSVLSTWKMVMIVLLSPIVFLVGMAFILTNVFQTDEHVQLFEIAIVDQDHRFETKMVIQQLTENRSITKLMKIIETDEYKAEEMLKKNQIIAMVVIPKGFSESIIEGINTQVLVIGNNQRPLQSQLVRHLLESATDFTSAAQSGINTVYYYMKKEPVSFTSKQLEAEYKKNIVSFALHVLGRGEIFETKEAGNLFQHNTHQYYALSLYLLLLLIWCFGLLFMLNGVIGDSIKIRLISIGVTRVQLTVVNQISLILLVTPVAFLFGIPLFHYLGMDLLNPSLLMAILLSTVLFCAFFIMLDSLTYNQHTYQFAGISLLIVGAIIGGNVIDPIYLPTWLAEIGRYTINSSSLGLLLTIFDGEPAYTQLLTLLALTFICLLITFMITRNQVRRWDT